MDKKYDVLKKYFGHDEFRPGQQEIVDSIMSGRDVLAVMPTGAGKSLCYQVPAMLSSGVTIVISPLISLMKDQVAALIQAGIPAAYINSSLTPAQTELALKNAADGKYKIVYAAPERLMTSSFLRFCRTAEISIVAVDEAHCISQWGQDFRPSYLKIVDFIDSLEKRPVVGAFTATATEQVKADIIDALHLNEPFSITTGFDRPNLYFSVMKPETKIDCLKQLLRQRSEKSGIVYCSTRKNVDKICAELRFEGFEVTRYHAGLDEKERRQNQDDFVYDRKNIMVATNAFGMGIDKSNVSFVIHYNMPQSIESYYQEAGRAGRDGSDADCILLFSAADIRTGKFLIENSEPNPELTAEEQEAVRQKDYERLKRMIAYCRTDICLRKFILSYFGEQSDSKCDNCSNCLTDFVTTDITVETQKILSCILRTGQRFGREMISGILRGSKSQRILDRELEQQSTYGIMSELSAKQLAHIIDELIRQGYIITDDGEMPVLKVASKGAAVLRRRERVTMRTAKQSSSAEQSPQKLYDVDPALLDELKKLRRNIANRSGVPSYVVFSDATLNEMCRLRPQNKTEFLAVSGVGLVKLQRYGTEFLEVLKRVGNGDEE